MLFDYFFVGLVAGFVFYELTDVSPGGVIAPAYFALYLDQPGRIVMTVAVALLLWLLLRWLSSRFVIFGRRRLLLAVLLGFCIMTGIDLWLQPALPPWLGFNPIGNIIPGLIASEMARQQPLPTLCGLGIVTAITFLVMLPFRG